MDRVELRALAALAASGWRRARSERAATLGRLALYWLILFIFWELWLATPVTELARPGTDAAHLFWYMVVTEWVALGVGFPYRVVEADIRSGQIAAGLSRPIPYALATLADWAGETGFRLIVMATGGMVAGVAVTGMIPFQLTAVPAIVASSGLACALILLCELQLGYAAAWVGSAAPLFWIWQKLTFVLGGLILPLTLYPQPLQDVARASPFAAMLFAPGSLALGASAADTAWILAEQVAWLAALGAATLVVDRAAAARFAERGV